MEVKCSLVVEEVYSIMAVVAAVADSNCRGDDEHDDNNLDDDNAPRDYDAPLCSRSNDVGDEDDKDDCHVVSWE
jgi:hypothetical protein